MSRPECDICRGRGFINLPIYRAVTASFDAAATTPESTESSRQYPCPECASIVPQDRVAILRVTSQVDSRFEKEPGFMPHAIGSICDTLSRELQHKDFLRIQQAPADPIKMTFGIRGTIGIVSRAAVATIEERAAEQQTKIANAAAELAIADIDNWGSFYGHSEILKSQAQRFIREALKKAVQRDKDWRRI